ncbi:MAG: hypothetical protein ACMG6S_04165, partial [Byssovorax sp.]
RRACALLIAAVLPACAAQVYIEDAGATGASGTASTGNGGRPGAGGGSSSSTMTSSNAGGTMSGSGTSGATGTGGSNAIPLAYSLKEYVGLSKMLWKGLGHASAVDSTGRLFVSDGDVVYAIKDGVPSIYLSHAELHSASGNDDPGVASLDVGPDDRLYILDSYYPYNILVSQGPHDVAFHLAVDNDALNWPEHIGAESSGRILLVTSNGGLYEITSEGTNQLYTDAAFEGALGCGVHDFAVSQDGDFYYIPNCNGSPLLGGATDGSGVDTVAKLKDLNEYYFWSFGGVARHPEGGAMVNLTGTAYYFDKLGQATELSMKPSMNTIKATSLEFPLFHDCPIEVGPSGEIYLIGGDRIYQATLQ